AARIMIFERERLQVGIKFGAKFEQRLQTDFHEKIIRDPIDEAPCELKRNQSEAEQGNKFWRRAKNGARTFLQNIIHDDFEWPGLEQIQPDSDKREKKPE